MTDARRAVRLLAPLALYGALAASACSNNETVNPLLDDDQGSAAPLHMFSTELSSDLREQALAALERDAFRREARFLDAAKPGYFFQSTLAPQAQIEAGMWSPDELFQLGGQLFNATFTPEIGFGAHDLPPIARFHTGRRGGPDATRCASCHWRGGPAGAGDAADNAYLDGDGDRQSSALGRNPIPLHGAGLLEIAASEITEDLAAIKAALRDQATSNGKAVRGELLSKGISFGHLTARPDGSFDNTEIEGIGDDLVVRPFGWKGNVRTVRDAVEDALLIHHGMQSEHLVSSASPERIGPFGGDDPDGDGVSSEILEGQVTVLTLFVAMQEVPAMVLPSDTNFALMWADGNNRFAEIGCAKCHVPSIPLRSTTFLLQGRDAGGLVAVDLANDAAEPHITPSAESGELRLFLFSDLKRHDIGPALAEPRADRGVAGAQFLTRPLWGVARSRPYLHDARAARLEDAILLHGGEAQAARDAYAALKEPERATIRVYLTSLTRAKRMVTQ